MWPMMTMSSTNMLSTTLLHHGSALQHLSRRVTPRTPIKRVRTGCFTCRRRKKKCDESKPICGNCRKTSIICEGYPQEVLWQSNRHPLPSQPSQSALETDQLPEEVSSNTLSLKPFQDAVYQPVDYEQPSSSATSLLDSQSLLQFDTNFDFLLATSPQDAPQPHNGDEAVWRHSMYETNYTTTTPEMYTSQALTETTQMQRSWSKNPKRKRQAGIGSIPYELPFLISGVDTPIQRQLFCHFTGTVSKVLTLSDKSSNPMNSTMVPIAMGSSAVMQALLSMAGSHLVRLHSGIRDNRLLAEKAQLHEKAVQSQSQHMQTFWTSECQTPPHEQEAMIATSLLLCLYELCEASGDDAWRIHLDVARRLIHDFPSSTPEGCDTAAQPTTASPQVHPFLLEYFIYHDSIAAVTSTSALIPETKPYRSTKTRAGEPYMIGVYDGLGEFISRISALRARSDELAQQSDAGRPTLNTPPGEIVCTAVEIWEDLSAWEPISLTSPQTTSSPANSSTPSTLPPTTSSPLSTSTSITPSDRDLITTLYRLALFIWLSSLIYPTTPCSPTVQTSVKQSTSLLPLLPPTTPCLSCLLFPLFIIGSAAIDASDREVVDDAFDRLAGWSQLGNVGLTREVVRGMWERYDEGTARSWDWMERLRERGVSVLVT